MNRKSMTRWLIAGGLVLAVMLASCAYSVLYNESRWVAPMDLSTYQFRIQDLPMLIAVPLFAVYILVLGFHLFQAARRQRLQGQPGYTRHLDPRMGLFGLFGFLGFLGFWTYATQRVIFPFFFFIFFGFFGFYYEGKLSDTLADEMFEEHRLKAQLKAYKIGMSLIFLMLWLVGFGLFSQQLDYVAIYLTIGISLAYAVTVFMSEYLLYRYERQE